MKKDFILEIYKSKNTVFTFKDIALLLRESNFKSLKAKVHYHVKNGVLKSVRKGVYVKSEYNKLELATKIYTPAYISLETVLQKDGIVFQYYDSIFTVSYISRNIDVDGNNIVFRKIKDDILLNPKGILLKGNEAIATTERAFLDTLYLYKNYHFDNKEPLDKEKVYDLLEIYDSKVLVQRVKEQLGKC